MTHYYRYTGLLAVLAAVLLTVGASGPVVAQAQNTTDYGGERITADLLLVNKTYDTDDSGNGTLKLTFEADGPTAVTLYDAGAFRQGGELPSRTQVIDGRHTVEMPVTKQGAWVGVTVVTGNTRYAVPHRVEQPDDYLFRGQPTWQDTRVTGLSGFLGGLFVITAVALYRVRSEKGEVEQVL